MQGFPKPKTINKKKCSMCKKKFDIGGEDKRFLKYCEVCKKNLPTAIKKFKKVKDIKNKIKKKPKEKSKKRLMSDLERVFSRYIRLRDAIRTTGGTTYVHCITCNDLKKVIDVDAGHFISRSRMSLKFDERNVHAQCKKCNMPPNSGEQYLYSKKLISLYGQKEVNRIMSMRNEIKKFTGDDLCDMIKLYRDRVNNMIQEHGSPWAQ